MKSMGVNTELTKIPAATRRGDDGKLLRLGLNQRPSDLWSAPMTVFLTLIMLPAILQPGIVHYDAMEA